MRNKTEMKRKNFYLTKKQIEMLEVMSIKNGISFSEMLRRAIDIYIRDIHE